MIGLTKYKLLWLWLLFNCRLNAGYNLPRPLVMNGTRFQGGVTIKGINWFGYNNGQTMVDGLVLQREFWGYRGHHCQQLVRS